MPSDSQETRSGGPRAINWAFTLNNYTEEDAAAFMTAVERGIVKYVIFGREISSTGTRHLQGFLQLVRRDRRPSRFLPQAHYERARSVPAAIEYCKKDGDWVEFGNLHRQGVRSDIELFMEDVKKEVFSYAQLVEKHPMVFAKYANFCNMYMDLNRPKPYVQEHNLRPWQQDLYLRLLEDPDHRTIIFVIDKEGNKGKTWFAHWFVRQPESPPSQVLLPGKKADMAYALGNDNRVIFIDAPRSKQGEYIQYDFLEELKNGYVFSSKFDSRIKVLPMCHVVVLMNEEPDMQKLSADRYSIIRID